MLVSRFDRETLPGFVNPQSYLAAHGLELLSTTGNLAILPYTEVKFVCFVRDFNQAEPRKEMRSFTSRPKHPGLWIRASFRDGDIMEGVLLNNLLHLEPAGFTFIPPDPGYQYQRLFVPRAALTDISVLGVIGGPLRRTAKLPRKEQLEMFEKG